MWTDYKLLTMITHNRVPKIRLPRNLIIEPLLNGMETAYNKNCQHASSNPPFHFAGNKHGLIPPVVGVWFAASPPLLSVTNLKINSNEWHFEH